MIDPSESAPRLVRFGVFELDLRSGDLRKAGARLNLPDQPLQFLTALLERPGELITRDELRQRPWADDTFVDFEHGLNAAVKRLRDTIGDSADTPRFIETVPRRGYRFIAPVDRDGPESESLRPPVNHTPISPRTAIEEVQRGSKRWQVVAAAGAVAIFVIGVALWMRGPARPADRSQWVQLTNFPGSVGEPVLSPDGRMLAFMRSSGRPQIYVKMLPDGQPVQLTHDNFDKRIGLAFSADGTRIAYTILSSEFEWDTWTLPVLGGEPQLLLKNASGLVWTGPCWTT